MTDVPQFGDVIRSSFVLSSGQVANRVFGKSDIKISGTPTRYHPGDLVNLPYSGVELSSIEAMGLAWSATVTGGVPAPES